MFIDCFCVLQVFLTETEIEEKIKKMELQEAKSTAKGLASLEVDIKKTVDNAVYTGFDEHELTDFPGFLEAPQLLNGITMKMDFKVRE